MPGYFLDTSALAKLYRTEIGTELIDEVLAEPASRCFISWFAVLELESVLAVKVRTSEIDEKSFLIARARFEGDLASRRMMVAAVRDQHFRDARRLLLQHATKEGLRAPDALQLSVALGLRRAGSVSIFVAADQKLCRVSSLEGFQIVNPEQPRLP